MSPNKEQTVIGFIVDSFHRLRQGRFELFFTCRLSDGRTCGIYETRFTPHFYVRATDKTEALSVLSNHPARVSSSNLSTMDKAEIVRVEFISPSFRQIMDSLHRRGIRTYEADLRPTDLFLMEHGLGSAITISGRPDPGKNIDVVFRDPDYSPANWTGKLAVLSFDIETAPDTARIYSIALCLQGTDMKQVSEVYIAGKKARGAHYCHTEREMLLNFAERVRQLDPDIITGWNICDFDFVVLQRQYQKLGIPFDLSRTGSPVKILDISGARSSFKRVIVEGRQVLDGLWLTRMSLSGFENYKLETIARVVLDKSKKIDLEEGENTAQKVEKLYHKQPEDLCSYCLEDARLVIEILEKCGLLELTVQKSLTIGLPLSKVHMSIASFEHLYISKLHETALVAPSLGVDRAPPGRSPGGGIVTPKPGLYHHVLLFDFKSLYPSLMKTFNLGPLAYIRAQDDDPIIAPNGAQFDRGKSIIAAIIDELMVKRDQAKKEKNEAASYAYKIIMNSFYGVLGTEGCRFANPDIAGAITSFGQHFLRWARDLLQSWGFEVLYGDTDSLFVLSGKSDTHRPGELMALGQDLASRINLALTEHIQQVYMLQSKLEIEFEKYYRRFFLPEIRHRTADNTEQRGRAKGYAGLLVEIEGDEVNTILDIVGLEAVRRDWTALARNLQRELLTLLFQDSDQNQLKSRIRELITELKAGQRNSECIYIKALRKPVSAYTRSKPPHVKAASLLPLDQQKGVIRYVITKRGPEPEGFSEAPLDHEHYLDKQIKPIVRSIDQIVRWNLEEACHDNAQLELFSPEEWG
ncbi:DNA polymerase II [candidate division CSSED10-310 bacterium]|uniref:DNA polymerase n=1 Tax=candidate division CSSED10-310 bacterium TaxID=2855610 RepID=A0ABV6YYU1_UNCC1